VNNEYLDISGIHGESKNRETLTGEEFPILKGLSPLSLRILNRAGRTMNVSKGVQRVWRCFMKAIHLTTSILSSKGKWTVVAKQDHSLK
jgi:hypothetical protein